MNGARPWTIALLVLGAAMAISSFWSASVSGDFGPWLMPAGTGLFLVVLGALNLRSATAPAALAGVHRGALAAVVLALLAYTFVLPYAGFPLTTSALVVLLAAVSSARPRWVVMAGSVALVIVLWVAFERLLGTPLPSGVL